MPKPVPPSVFFGSRTTRAVSKLKANDPVPTLAATTSKASEPTISAGRQLRSAAKNKVNVETLPKAQKTSSDSTLANETRRGQLKGRNTPDQESSSAVSSPQSPKQVSKLRRTSGRKESVIKSKKNPVYKQTISEPQLQKKEVKNVFDEYEFESDFSEETGRRPKKRRQKPKVQTLWGLTVRPTTNKNPSIKTKTTKSVKTVKFTEVENFNPVIVDGKLSQKAQNIKKCVPLQERTVNTLEPKVSPDLQKCNVESIVLSDSYDSSKNSNEVKLLKRPAAKTMKENTLKKSDISIKVPVNNLPRTPLKERSVGLNVNSTPVNPKSSQNLSIMLSPIQRREKRTLTEASFLGSENVTSSTPSQQRCSENVNKPFLQAAMPSPIPIPEEVVNKSSNNFSTRESTCHARQTSLSEPNAEENRCCSPLQRISVSSEVLSTSCPGDNSDNRVLSNSSTNTDNSGYLDHDLLDTSNIFSDIPKDAKFSIPARLLGPIDRRIPGSFGSNCLTKPSLGPISKPPFRATLKPPQLETIPQGSILKEKPSQIQAADLNVDNCFGFSEDSDEECHLPVIQPPRHVQKRRGILYETKNLPPVEKVNEMLLSSLPKSKVPEKKRDEEMPSSLSMKIRPAVEDSDESTSSSWVSSDDSDVIMKKQDVPGPLFEDIVKDDLFKSPFIQPPRRSYERPKRLRQLHIRDESEEEEEPPEDEPPKKKPTTYKRTKKMVQTTLADQWAKNLSSHFAEVDDVELIVE